MLLLFLYLAAATRLSHIEGTFTSIDAESTLAVSDLFPALQAMLESDHPFFQIDGHDLMLNLTELHDSRDRKTAAASFVAMVYDELRGLLS